MAITNEELISELRKLPPDAKVIIFTSESQCRDLDQVDKVPTVGGKPVIMLSDIPPGRNAKRRRPGSAKR